MWNLDYFQHTLSRQALLGLGREQQMVGVCHHKAKASGSVIPGTESGYDTMLNFVLKSIGIK